MPSARAFACLLLLSAPALAQDAWSGAWASDAVRLELQAADGGYQGALTVSGQRYPVTAAREGAGLRGSFAVQGARFEWTAQRAGDLLVLRSDGNEHRLRRVSAPAQAGWRWEPLTLPHSLAQTGAAAARAAPEGRSDAPALLRGALSELERAFGAPARPAGALCDAEGREGQLLFESRQQGAPVRGVVVVRSAGPSGPHEVAVGWAPAAQFAGAWAGLLQALGRAGQEPAQAAPAVEWQPVTQFPDGSGQIRVPRGWQVTFAQKGAVDANGPQGWLSLGAARTVTTPQAAAQQQQMFGMTPPLVAAYTNPAQVLLDMVPSENAWAARTNAQWRTESLRVLEQSPTEYPQGQAAYVHTEGVTLDTHTGKRVTVRGLTLVIVAPVSAESFMYYTSGVGAPAEQWASSLPVLLEVWRSWQVSQQELQRRLDKAAATMREIHAIIRGASAERLRAYEDVNKAWNHVLRGDWPIEDREAGGARQNVDTEHLRPTLEALNREAGYERWREVPLRELVPR